MAKAETVVATVGWYAAKILRTVRERIQMGTRYKIEDIADAVAAAVDELFVEPLNARLTAEVTGEGRIMLTVQPYIEETGHLSPKAQVFTVTVTDGYSMIIGPVDDDDDDEKMHASWGERF